MLLKLKIWFAQRTLDFAIWMLIGNESKHMATPSAYDAFKRDRRTFNRKDAKRCSEEIELKKQVERYKGRMIIMRGWLLNLAPDKCKRMDAWFDNDGEPM